ncbi:RWP-RK domain, partial [Musa troglodytarum]
MTSAPPLEASGSRSPRPQQQQQARPPPSGTLTFDEISKLFSLPIAEAAPVLGVCTSVLKKICRDYGIVRTSNPAQESSKMQRVSMPGHVSQLQGSRLEETERTAPGEGETTTEKDDSQEVQDSSNEGEEPDSGAEDNGIVTKPSALLCSLRRKSVEYG